ncbi:MAG: Crp/Fnr family transcriptional regulator [Rhodocyclaceae bacterium]|nr:Crp/Fnr family transcriptional regulator [Rhodocyclaceae bacterium]MDZ4215313.1 Crp/Fnr family transcriptional regulator [Rhodocyclaceae bacterium]
MTRQRNAKKIDIRVVLSQLPMFQEIDDEHLERIVAASELVSIRKEERLFNKGDPASGFYVVVTGKIKLALPINNSERVIDVLGPRRSFGEALMFMLRTYPVFAQALMDSTLIHVPQEPIFELLASDPLFARRMLAGMSLRLHNLILDIDTFSRQTGTQRLVSYLLQHLPQSNDTPERSPIVFPLPTTKQLIASHLCMAPETLSRALHELCTNDLIEVNRNLITIKNLSSLRNYC